MVTSWKMQRIIAELSQEDLARESGISRYRVSLIERGVRPTDEEYDRLVKVLAYREQQQEASR